MPIEDDRGWQEAKYLLGRSNLCTQGYPNRKTLETKEFLSCLTPPFFRVLLRVLPTPRIKAHRRSPPLKTSEPANQKLARSFERQASGDYAMRKARDKLRRNFSLTGSTIDSGRMPTHRGTRSHAQEVHYPPKIAGIRAQKFEHHFRKFPVFLGIQSKGKNVDF